MTVCALEEGGDKYGDGRCEPSDPAPPPLDPPQESEGEDAEASRVTLAQDLGRGNVASRQSRVRLHEIGPRMELEVIKVRRGRSSRSSM